MDLVPYEEYHIRSVINHNNELTQGDPFGWPFSI